MRPVDVRDIRTSRPGRPPRTEVWHGRPEVHQLGRRQRCTPNLAPVGVEDDLIELDRRGRQVLVEVAARLVGDRDAIADATLQRLQWRAAVVRYERCRPAADDLGARGVLTEDRKAPDRVEVDRQRTVVAQQHRRFDRRAVRDRAVPGPVDRLLLAGRLVVQRAEPLEGAEQAAHDRVEPRLVELAGAHPVRELRAVLPAGPRHLQIEAGARQPDRRRDREPVGHHEAVEAPLLAQDP
jgi:hypothetical protein